MPSDMTSDLNHSPVLLEHGRITLALHRLRDGNQGDAEDETPRLLLLHSLGSRTPKVIPSEVAQAWQGSVWGLDFSGHGQSSIATGGGYSAEVLMADVDTALRHLGPCTLLGAGLGGYIALLIAGAAPQRVERVIVTGGSGLAGGGVRPGSEQILVPVGSFDGTTPDAFALMELSSDVRPPNYIASFVRQFVGAREQPRAVCVATAARPPWLSAVVEEYGVEVTSLTDALQ
jgi:pimeloyl-ACP methyl ester carboxylesterase